MAAVQLARSMLGKGNPDSKQTSIKPFSLQYQLARLLCYHFKWILQDQRGN